MKPYLASVSTFTGGLLVVGLEHLLARLVAVAILVTATLILGMAVEAVSPSTED